MSDLAPFGSFFGNPDEICRPDNFYKLDDLEFMQFEPNQNFEVLTVIDNPDGGWAETQTMSLYQIETTDFSSYVDVDLFPHPQQWSWDQGTGNY